MAGTDRFTVFSLAIGSLLVASGWTVTAIYAFRGALLETTLGYFIFTAGYKTCWYGTHRIDSFKQLLELTKNGGSGLAKHFRNDLENYILIVAGVTAAAYGTTLFAQVIIENAAVFQLATAGFLCFLGYVVAHEGVNEVLI